MLRCCTHHLVHTWVGGNRCGRKTSRRFREGRSFVEDRTENRSHPEDSRSQKAVHQGMRSENVQVERTSGQDGGQTRSVIATEESSRETVDGQGQQRGNCSMTCSPQLKKKIQNNNQNSITRKKGEKERDTKGTLWKLHFLMQIILYVAKGSKPWW